MKPRTLLQGLAGLAAWGCLSGLALVRLWAVLYGRVPGPAILAAAAALAALVVGAAWRLRLVPRLLLPFGPTWRTALLAGAAFFLGALLDTSYGLFSAGDMAIGRLPFRLVCALGSGLVLAGVVLALATAARRFGRLELPRGRALLLLALAVNVLTALYAAGSATVYYWDSNIYWSSSTMLAGQSLDLAQVRLVLQSVITQEYNYLLSWPISLVMRVLGTGRYVYLFAVANLYVMPALAGMAALARRVRRGGLLLAGILSGLKGPDAVSKMVTNMAFGAYNKAFGDKPRTPNDWLSADTDNVDRYMADPLCGADATVGLFRQMLHGIRFKIGRAHV